MSYERENICIFEGAMVWGARWTRPECGCFLMGGLTFMDAIELAGEFDASKMHWAFRGCPDHERQIAVVMKTMQEMPPSDEEMGALFTRLLEDQLALGIQGPVI